MVRRMATPGCDSKQEQVRAQKRRAQGRERMRPRIKRTAAERVAGADDAVSLILVEGGAQGGQNGGKKSAGSVAHARVRVAARKRDALAQQVHDDVAETVGPPHGDDDTPRRRVAGDEVARHAERGRAERRHDHVARAEAQVEERDVHRPRAVGEEVVARAQQAQELEQAVAVARDGEVGEVAAGDEVADGALAARAEEERRVEVAVVAAQEVRVEDEVLEDGRGEAGGEGVDDLAHGADRLVPVEEGDGVGVAEGGAAG